MAPGGNMIPERYVKASGIEAHRFRVTEPWHRPYEFLRQRDGTVAIIDASAYCVLLLCGEKLRLLVDIARQPRLGQAILDLGKFWFESTRLGKYFTLYRLYESLAPRPDLSFSAVRHGLSHASAVLTRPKTVAELHRLFGSTEVDLRLPTHQRVFYVQLGKMLVATDTLLAEALQHALPTLRILSKGERPAHPWQVQLS